MPVLEWEKVPWVAIRSRYNKDFINALKSLAFPKAWDADRKAWVFSGQYMNDVVELMTRFAMGQVRIVGTGVAGDTQELANLRAQIADLTKQAQDLTWRLEQATKDVLNWRQEALRARKAASVPQWTPSTPYRVLGLLDGAPPALVKAAYKALAFEHHPDRGGDANRFILIRDAYEELKSRLGF